MALGIPGRYYISLVLGNTEIPVSDSNILYVHQIENVRSHLPSLQMSLIDPTGTLTSKNSIGDGTKIFVNMGLTKEDLVKPYTSYFSVGAPDTKSSPYGVITTFRGLGVAPKWTHDIPKAAYVGSSSAVLQTLASESNLTAEVDSTNDSQTWLSHNKTYGSFTSDIIKAGWIDSNSCMISGVTDLGILKYKNLTKLAQKQPQYLLFFGPTDNIVSNSTVPTFMIYHYGFVSHAGVNNKLKGYNAVATNFNLDGTIKKQDKITIGRISQNMEMASEIKSLLGTGFSKIYPMDCGNTHANYYEALHQNERGLSLWGNSVAVMVQADVPINLLDVVQLHITQNGAQNTAYNGKYVVAAKTKTLQTSFATKLLLVAQGRAIDSTEAQTS